MKQIRALIRSCPDCPFLETLEQHIHADTGDYPMGWFCLHKAKRGYIVELKNVAGAGLREYLMDSYGRPFPPDCPLPDASPVPTGKGVRTLDLQPVVNGLDKKS